ncbi:MAG: tetratricopeptide repeat protein [Gammaproteobacteria bacterium]|nr:tetratricopeptide repeat protein [Gammaproteobacteria bacterium]
MANRSNTRPAPWMRDTLREGFSLLAAGRPEEASECCRRLLGAQPDLVEAHFLVGLIALELKQNAVAISAFGSVTQLQPDHGAAWAHLARQFMRVGQAIRADAALEKAAKYADGNPVVFDLIAASYGLLGDQEEASKWMAKAVDKEPNSVPFLVNQANSHMFLGKLDDAEAVLRKVLGFQPGNPNANWTLSNVRKAKNRDHIEQLQELVQQEKQSPRALAFLYYGLGKELEDLEDWDGAFDAFAQGAKARRSTVEFDEQSEIEMFQAFGDLFTPEWMEKDAFGHDSPSPIFVVGQPRTGTTLVERIITSHSSVHSAGELKQFGHSVRRLSKYNEPARYSAKLGILAAEVDCHKLGQAYMATTQKMRGSLPRFVDKLPPNYLYLPLILKALPNAKIIHLTRNPMDACFSSFKQLFADAYPHSYDQAEMARHHARYYHLMALWRERFGDRFFDISYEDTARDVEPNARALIDFLGLPWEDACLHFHKQDAAVTTASAVQVRQPAHTRSIGRWRRYEQQLGTMQDVLRDQGLPIDG